ncbi:MAG TPA: twin-arginine translocase subunit TatC [Caldilineae bacterium]|nr:twin-arginine translocase subunit TatC [Caldilineae bacterium]
MTAETGHSPQELTPASPPPAPPSLQATPPTAPEPEEPAQPIIEHLLELRGRLLKATLALIVGGVIGLFFAKPFLEVLISPLQGASELQLLKPTESIFIYLKGGLILGAIIASPFILYQIFAFIVPGLTEREKRGLYLVLPLAAGLFALGVAFAAFIVLPFTLRYLQTFLSDLAISQYSFGEYMNFVLSFLFWLGLAFEIPLVIAILARLGIVTPQQLQSTWRYAVVIIAVLAAVITPTPDPFTMSLVMMPLLGLYVLGIFMARMAYKPREAATPRSSKDAAAGVDGDGPGA